MFSRDKMFHVSKYRMTQMRGSGLDTDTLPIIYATISKNSGCVSHELSKKYSFFVSKTHPDT